jgi:hypothetical protein
LTPLASIAAVENLDVLHSISSDVVLYRRAILKIAYELAWLWLGDASLDDPTASDLRNTSAGGEDLGGGIQRANPNWGRPDSCHKCQLFVFPLDCKFPADILFI